MVNLQKLVRCGEANGACSLCVCNTMCVRSGYFGLISADVPYGDQKDHGVDPPWSDTELLTIVEGIWHMAALKCTVVIQVGGIDLAGSGELP